MLSTNVILHVDPDRSSTDQPRLAAKVVGCNGTTEKDVSTSNKMSQMCPPPLFYSVVACNENPM